MAHRDKIFQALRAKHKNVPKQVLDKVADHLEKGVNEENEVETSVDSADGLVSGFSSFLQSETDRRVNEALTKKKTTNEPAGGDDQDDEPGDDKDTPAWAKAMMKQNKELADKVTALEAGKTQSARQTRLLNGIKGIEGIDEKFYSRIIAGRTFNDDAEVDAMIESVKTGWIEEQQDRSNRGLGQQSKPASAGIVTTNGKVTPASKEELDKAMSNII